MVAVRVTRFPQDQQLTWLCKSAGCSCQRSDRVTCWPFGVIFSMYSYQCSSEWCHCFDNKENKVPIEHMPLHPNIAANNRAPANVANAPPASHHRKQQTPGAACMGSGDCAGDNYVCMVPNAASGQSQQQPGTCTWFANAAAAVVASSALGIQCQHGRCLSAANSSNAFP